MQNTKEGEIGLAAVRAAAILCEAVRTEMVAGRGPDKLDKSDRSPVTVADFGAQALVCRLIGDAFPEDAIVAEEDSQMLREPGSAEQMSALRHFVNAQAGAADAETVCAWIDRGNGETGARFWALDPIDGTKGFLRNDQYAVALALIERGSVQWGFLACPALPYRDSKGVVFVAQRGAGAHAFALDGELLGPVRVSELGDVKQARVIKSVEASHTDSGVVSEFKTALNIASETILMDSQAKYGAVASGQADIYLRLPNPRRPDYRENIWDHAAGAIVVEEAGGKVTDAYGNALDWTQRRQLKNIGVVATNGHLHDLVIGTLARFLP
ncbi:MAG TPA: 3'(2'),5'-bisphosphate nucleotidase [Blastocatellia bacterium]|nr:3'(2'),5'-bisphosphate nucleotidase [Blastocatellia bacterium]